MFRICIDLIPVLLLSGWILYENQMAYIAMSPLGKLIAIALIVYYSKVNILYGLLMCAIIIVYYFFEYRKSNSIIDEYFNGYSLSTNTSSANKLGYSENFSTMNDFKDQNCKNGVLLNKGSPVNLEMTEHIYPDIQFKNGKCDPCSDTCNFSIIEEQLKADESLKPKTSDDFSLNRVLEKINNFIPALWVKSERFLLLSESNLL